MSNDENFVTEQLRKKWAPVIEHADMPSISDEYRKNVTAVLLENQQQYLKEAAPANQAGTGLAGLGSDTNGSFHNVAGFDPVLISLVRRAMPNLMAYDVCGVQPMNAPTGLIFAMKAKYASDGIDAAAGVSGTAEALFNEARTMFGATSAAAGNSAAPSTLDPLLAVDSNNQGGFGSQPGMSTSFGEALGDASGNYFNEMGFVIDRQSVVAKTRALKAEYTTELAQDLKAVHGLDAETELANILSTEILTEINREVMRTIYKGAKLGGQQPDLFHKGFLGGSTLYQAAANAGGSGAFGGLSGGDTAGYSHAAGGITGIGGVYDLELDSDGRWSAERFRGLVYQIEREANVIAKETRRGKGNFVIVTSDVASALAMSGFLNLTPTPSVPGMPDDTQNTFIGTLNGNIKVYIDPYSEAGKDWCCVGYRGSSPYDAGMFYCPYVPLQMVKAVGEQSFQPKIGFKTRYGLVNNPFVGASDPSGSAAIRNN
jgi:hypothetical protein